MTLKDLRHTLHKYPELSGREMETADRIVGFLKKYNPDKIVENIGGFGLYAEYSAKQAGPTVIIRCDLDALPIDEQTDLDYKSQNKGVSHKCGHDGHMAIVAGLAAWLSENPIKKGKLILLFQPAEETGGGAFAMINDGLIKELNPDYIFALHNLPGYPKHSVIMSDGQMTPSVLSLSIELKGLVSHAAQPHLGINPTLAISTLNLAIIKLANTNADDPSYSMITPVHTLIGTKDFGISPGKGEVNFTLRSWNEETMNVLKKDIERIVRDTATLYKLESRITESDFFPSVVNSEECIKVVESAAAKLNLKILKLDMPIKFGEDFGFFTRECKAALFGLGAGKDTLPLHHKDYDFDDELLESGVGIFKEIVNQILG